MKLVTAIFHVSRFDAIQRLVTSAYVQN